MCKSYLYHRQKRPHSGYNRSQEWCLKPFRHNIQGGHSSVQAGCNVVETDLSYSAWGGHLRDKNDPGCVLFFIRDLVGELSTNYWLSMSGSISPWLTAT
jgi:hypothetical protein